MKNTCMIVIAALLIAVPLTLWSQNVQDGADFYKTRCAACHGDKGEGTLAGKIPAVKGTPLSVEKIVALLSKGEGGKTVHATPLSPINADEAKATAQYVKNLK